MCVRTGTGRVRTMKKGYWLWGAGHGMPHNAFSDEKMLK